MDILSAGHLAFRVEDVEATVAELEQMGIGCEPIRLDSYTQKKKMIFSLIQMVCHWNCMNKKQRPHS